MRRLLALLLLVALPAQANDYPALYSASGRVLLTPGQLTANGATWDVTASAGAAAALAAAVAAQATATGAAAILATFTAFGTSIATSANAGAVKTLLALAKGDVGLGNVDNTSDANKPVSTAQASADALRLLLTGGTLSGDLGIGGAPTAQLDVINMTGGTNANVRIRGDVGSNALDVFSGVSGHGFYGYGSAKSMLFGTNGATRFTLAASSGFHVLEKSWSGNGGVLAVKNTNASGYSFIDFYDSSANKTCGFGYANASVAGVGGKAYFYSLSKDLFFSTDGGSQHLSVSGATGAVGILTSLAVGASGTAITQVRVYTPSLTPALVVAIGEAEQTFTVTGLSTSDTLSCNGPAPAALTAMVHCRVSAADTLALQFNTLAVNVTPSSGSYRILAFRN